MSAPPRAGEIWRVDLEPTQGSEQGKSRPVVVMNEPPTGRVTIRLCAPIVHRKREHAFYFWCAERAPDSSNGLTEASSVDAAQTRALDTSRFLNRLGEVRSQELEIITTALCLCVGREPKPK